MNDFRERIDTHRQDALILLGQMSKTAQDYEGFRLAGAVCHIARAQVLLTEEIEGMVEGSGQETGSAKGSAEPSTSNDDPTPVDGIRFPMKDPKS